MSKTIRVGLIGATGYTALEVARLLASHPSATVTAATSRSDAGQPLSAIHPSLTGRCDVVVENLDPEAIARKCDVAMCCLPHGASAQTVKALVEQGLRVIDFSADFRLSDLTTYEKWYDVTHPWPERFGTAAYGMPEFFRDQIRQADIVANPGCYPTSAILPLSPLVSQGIVETEDIIVDSKSGVSGAGRNAKITNLYCEANESIAAYAVGSHRHQPEIDDLVRRVSGKPVKTIFTPHLTPMDRGILSTIYVKPTSPSVSADRVMACWREVYGNSVFVQPVDHLPTTKHVAGTNYVQMTARASGDRLVLVCVIDNLAKGASGAAIQNLNVMFGLDEATGLA